MSTAYAGIADLWARDAALVYGPLARHLVALAPRPMRGCLALDAGCGSGAAGDALRAAGARVVGADLEPDMASHGAGLAVAGDVSSLPFRSSAFDVAVAAFVINHLASPVAGLAELRRVLVRGGTVLVSAFSVDRSAAKAAVDEVAASFGFVPPAWYVELQRRGAAVGSVERMVGALRDAGFGQVEVTERALDVGLSDPQDVVRYRLAVPHLHAFAGSLGAARRALLVERATAAVAATGAPFVPAVVEAVAVS